MIKPTHLRVEHLDEPLGLTVTAPRMSWRLPEGTRRQLAYRIRAGRWDSGRVESDESILIPYDGPELHSGERVEWTVKVWTDAGESEWAEPSWWEMGLLSPQDWVVDWIEPPEPEDWDGHGPHPVHYLRGVRHIDGPIERARLYVTAHGVYEFFINGVRVGDAELTPGFTSYHSRLQVQTYDVTDLLKPGENILGAILSGGWVKWRAWTLLNSDLRLGLIAQLCVEDADGQQAWLGSGGDWLVGSGAVTAADLQMGQVVDFRQDQPGWNTAADLPRGEQWVPVQVAATDLTRMTGSPAPPVRRVEEVKATDVWRLGSDRQIVDLGQNINGWIRLGRLGEKGTELTLTYGEALDENGDVTTDNAWSRQTDPLMDELPWDFAGEKSAPFQTDRVISAGRADDYFEPRHTTHGFRYVRIDGLSDDLKPEDVAGVVVHTDMRRTGWFECSDDRLNKLHEAVVWTFRSNACDIPTDCPTRERAGWTGDWQVFLPTAAFLYDVAGFSTKWLYDLAAEQHADGRVGHCAPESTGYEIQAAMGMPPGCAGFGDAAVIVPWEIYKAYGDRGLLEQQWPSMVSWVEYAARQARENRHPSRQAMRPEPAPHEEYLWDTGFHWGEWNEPDSFGEFYDEDVDSPLRAFTEAHTSADHGAVATAYLSWSAQLLSRAAHVLGYHDKAAEYSRLSARSRLAWQQEFLTDDGRVVPETQATYVRALAFDLLPTRLRAPAAAHLVELIRKADNHLGTGFLATPYLLPVLADNGYTDVAYDLLFQDTEPSWLVMIDRGGTTIWEHWSGLDENGLPAAPPGVGSLNHFSKGAVASFLHRYVGGIHAYYAIDKSLKVEISPRPETRVSRAAAICSTPKGEVSCSWFVNDNKTIVSVDVPEVIECEVVSRHKRKRYRVSPGINRFVIDSEKGEIAYARSDV